MSVKWIASVVLFAGLFASSLWAETESEPRKKLIAWGGLDWYSPETIRDNIRAFEELPFDGTILSGFKLNKGGDTFDWRCWGQEKFEREHLSQTIETLKAIEFKKFTDNFLRYNMTPGVDWFDDFSAVLHNARMWAAVTKETGMKGWSFDVEDYSGIKDTNFTYKRKKYAKEKSFKEYEAQARLRGREFMQAVQEGNPDIVLLLMLAHSYVNRTPHASEKLAELDDYGLLPAFVNGMIEVADPNVRIINGQEEAYGHFTPEEFFRGYHNIRQSSLALVPPELWGKYRAKVEAGTAVYVNSVLALTEYPGWWPAHYLTPEERVKLIEQNVYYALKSADEYAWFYSESMKWLEPGATLPTPDGTLEAIRSGREKAQKDEPLNIDMTARVAIARATLKAANPYPVQESVLQRVSAGGTAPTIDGTLDDSAWKDVQPLHPLVAPAGGASDDKPLTTTQATFDDQNLYFAFRCAEPSSDKPTILGENKDDDNIRKGDCVEIFFRGGERVLPFHFILNPNNVTWDGKGDFAEWNGEWQSAAKMGNGEWTAEFAIPWATIGGRSASLSVLTELSRRRAAANELSATVQNLVLPAQ